MNECCSKSLLAGSLSRRTVIKAGSASLLLLSAGLFSAICGCKRKYSRPPGDYNLGSVQDLLYTQQLVRDRDILVTRDQEGWAAMSTQCSYEGCALSYQDERFLCTCCGSSFDHLGKILKGPAIDPLPYFAVRYVDGNLYADSGKIVSLETRFTTPELEEAIARLAERIKKEGTRAGSRIPDILLGKGDQQELGPMFEERRLEPGERAKDEEESEELTGE